VEALFEAISYCASLNADDVPDEDDDADDAFLDAEGDEFVPVSDEAEMSEVGRVRTDYVGDSARFRPY